MKRGYLVHPDVRIGRIGNNGQLQDTFVRPGRSHARGSWRANKDIGLAVGRHGYLYPVWQFTRNGTSYTDVAYRVCWLDRDPRYFGKGGVFRFDDPLGDHGAMYAAVTPEGAFAQALLPRSFDAITS